MRTAIVAFALIYALLAIFYDLPSRIQSGALNHDVRVTVPLSTLFVPQHAVPILLPSFGTRRDDNSDSDLVSSLHPVGFYVRANGDGKLAMIDPSQGFGCTCVFYVSSGGSGSISIGGSTPLPSVDLANAISTGGATLSGSSPLSLSSASGPIQIPISNVSSSGDALVVADNSSTACASSHNLITFKNGSAIAMSISCTGNIVVGGGSSISTDIGDATLDDGGHLNSSATCNNSSHTNVNVGCRVTLNGAGNLTVTFATAFSVSPVCTGTDESSTSPVEVQPTTTNVKLIAGIGDVVDVQCLGDPD